MFSPVLIDKGSPDVTVGPDLSLPGKIGNKFQVTRGSKVFVNCDFADAGGFPYDPDQNLPAIIEYSFNGVTLSSNLTCSNLFSGLHGNLLCFDVDLYNFTGGQGTIQCKSTSRITVRGIQQMDSATSNIMLVGEFIL